MFNKQKQTLKKDLVPVSPRKVFTPPRSPEVSALMSDFSDRILLDIELDGEHPYISEIKTELDKHLVGQENAKKQVAEQVVQSIISVRPKRGPLGVFFFHGPTGVGKTEIVKALAKVFFGNERGFTKVNCENLQESHNASNLFGSAKGYIGYGDKLPFQNKLMTQPFDTAQKSGKLHHSIRSLPWFNIILFDEIEKAHPNIAQQLLSMIDDGHVMLSDGENANFENTIIIFTTNLGQKEISESTSKSSIGFHNPQTHDSSDNEKIFQKSLKKQFSPEFLGRIDSFIEFDPLTPELCKSIIDLQLKEFNDLIHAYFTNCQFRVEFGNEIYDYLISQVDWKNKGAREIIRAYINLIESKISTFFNSKKFAPLYHISSPLLISPYITQSGAIYCRVESNAEPLIPTKTTKNAPCENGEKPYTFTLEKISYLNQLIAKFIDLATLQYEDDIDFRIELSEIIEELEGLGMPHEDIAILKTKSFLKYVASMDFVDEFTDLVIDDGNLKVFEPYKSKIIEKIVKQTFAMNREKYEDVNEFIHYAYQQSLRRVTSLISNSQITSEQMRSLGYIINKILQDEYGITIKHR